MAFKTIKIPSNGEKITMGSDGKLHVPAPPLIPFHPGTGTGPDLWRAPPCAFGARPAAPCTRSAAAPRRGSASAFACRSRTG